MQSKGRGCIAARRHDFIERRFNKKSCLPLSPAVNMIALPGITGLHEVHVGLCIINLNRKFG